MNQHPSELPPVDERDLMRDLPRTLFFTMQEPDFPSGSPAILANILERWPQGRASVLCEMRMPPERRRHIEVRHPLRRLRLLTALWNAKRGHKVRRILWVASSPLLLMLGLREIRAIRAEVIFTIYGNGLWILTAYCLSRISGVPLVLYVHDAWRERVVHERPWLYRVIERLEREALGHSTLVVLSDGLQKLYRDRYGLDSVVVRHMAAGPLYCPEPSRDRLTLGFAGAIYGNNLVQLQALVRLVADLGEWRLRLFTDVPLPRLQALGLVGERVETVFEADPEMLRRSLSRCTALYLPLAFEDAPDLPVSLLRHAVPTKMIDYLMSGPPILAHCPEDFEVAHHVLSLKLGEVVVAPGVEGIRAVLTAWTTHGLPTVAPAMRERALALFNPDQNFERLASACRAAVRVTSNGAIHGPDQSAM